MKGNRVERGPIRGQYIVTLEPGYNPRSVAAITRVDTLHIYEHALNGFAAKLTHGQANALRHHKGVVSVEEDQTAGPELWEGFQTQQLDENGEPWGLDRIDQMSTALRGTYRYRLTGRGVAVYVLDTGIDPSHPEFGGRARHGANFTSSPQGDVQGHGTHVAGTIGGKTYGVAKEVALVNVKVLGDTGSGSYSGIIAGIDWVLANRVGPAVINMSLGGGRSAALNAAVNNAVTREIPVIVAAGNEGTDACATSPASALMAITVAASTRRDDHADFSNHGPCVDLHAPGVDVLSALPGGSRDAWSGTSMAAPHVAGVAALYLERHPGASAAHVESYIVGKARPDRLTGLPPGTVNRMLAKLDL